MTFIAGMLGKEDCSVSTPTVEATIIRGTAENTVRDEEKELPDNGKEPKEE